MTNAVDTRASVTETLFRWSKICIATLDPGQRILDVSVEFLRHFGSRPDDLVGQDFPELLHPGTRDKVRRKFERLLTENRTSFQDSIVGLGPSDSMFSGELTGYVARSERREVNALVVVIRPHEAEYLPSTTAMRQQKVLTALDARILEGVAAGASTIQLAARLHLSRQGVEYRIASMFRKLKATNRAALVSRAYTIGALTTGSWPPRVQSDFVA